MASWVGPVAAISLLVIALCYLAIAGAVLKMIREAAQQGQILGKELGQLRAEMRPALQAINRLGDSTAEITDIAKKEVTALVETSARLRQEVEQGVIRARERLADFGAVVDVVQEEIEDTAVDFTAALRSVRTGAGVVGRLRRMLMPRRRPSR